jgi:hypothetical protein
MHPIIPLAVLSWIIVFSMVGVIDNLTSIFIGQAPYQDISPLMACAMICLVSATETFIQMFRMSQQ